MKKDLIKKIEIPEGVEVSVEGKTVIVKGNHGENKEMFKAKNISFSKKDNFFILSSKNATKKEKRVMNTLSAHIKNMINGVKDKFEYKLKICNSHFPITVEIKEKEAFIKNFLGEKIPRKVKLLDDVDIKVDKDIITIISTNKKFAGQTAANFEKSTFLRMRDRRIFQDGIFITNKPEK